MTRYSNPYVAGVGLGLVLLTAFVVTGRGLGASGAFATTAAGVTRAVDPARAAASPYLSKYTTFNDWLLFEILGVVAGGWISAKLAGRVRGEIERGPHATPISRLSFAATGGATMGLGSVLARGCTSGQALTGGALLSVGSWIFVVSAFAAAYLAAPLLRRAWR